MDEDRETILKQYLTRYLNKVEESIFDFLHDQLNDSKCRERKEVIQEESWFLFKSLFKIGKRHFFPGLTEIEVASTFENNMRDFLEKHFTELSRQLKKLKLEEKKIKKETVNHLLEDINTIGKC